MLTKFGKNLKKHRNAAINWGAIAGIIAGLFTTYWQTHSNKSEIVSSTKWIGDNLKDKSEKLESQQRQIDELRFQLQTQEFILDSLQKNKKK